MTQRNVLSLHALDEDDEEISWKFITIVQDRYTYHPPGIIYTRNRERQFERVERTHDGVQISYLMSSDVRELCPAGSDVISCIGVIWNLNKVDGMSSAERVTWSARIARRVA